MPSNSDLTVRVSLFLFKKVRVRLFSDFKAVKWLIFG